MSELKNVQKTADNLLRQTKQIRNISQTPKEQQGPNSQIKKSIIS